MKDACAPEALAAAEKEREMLKEVVLCLQEAKESQCSEYEQLCFDLLNCVFMMQNSEKQTLNEHQKSQQHQLTQKFKSLDEQRLSQIKSLTDKVTSLQKQVQQNASSHKHQAKQPVVQGPVRKVSVTDAPPTEIKPTETKPAETNAKKMEDQIKLLRSELLNRDAKMTPAPPNLIFKKLLKSLYQAKSVIETIQKKDQQPV